MCYWRIQVVNRELHLAAREDDTDTIQRLISDGTELNIRDTVSIKNFHDVLIGIYTSTSLTNIS